MNKIFDNLFILDLANNHQGCVEHGLRIIKEMGEVVRKNNIKAALKFQFRQLDTFIHPDFKSNKVLPHISRFISTVMSVENYQLLVAEVRKQGMLTMCTPFDEESVDHIVDLDFDFIKVASCSAKDRPLLEKIANTGKPIIVSTAALSVASVDRLVCFLEHKNISFALMHCVALYPTPNNMLKLNRIDRLKSRFPTIPIGFSTHEEPDNLIPVRIACAKGVSILERHVGLETEKYKLNKYSSEPQQIDKWIKAFKDSSEICGGEEHSPGNPTETDSLRSLQRGVYAKRVIKKGIILSSEDVYFAMPLQSKQLSSEGWHDGFIANENYSKNQYLAKELSLQEVSKEEHIFRIMLQIKGMLNIARIFIGEESSIEISHHYGLERFREFGAVIVNCINRTYCKKLIIQLPRQKHPYHFHKKKEETFQLLYGDLEVELEGHRKKLKPGDLFLVNKNQWHKFHALDGAIFEEISTRHYNDDSFYEDEKIALLPREARKTEILNWEASMKDKF